MDDVGPVDQVGIEERVAKYGTRSIKKNAKVFGLKLETRDGEVLAIAVQEACATRLLA